MCVDLRRCDCPCPGRGAHAPEVLGNAGVHASGDAHAQTHGFLLRESQPAEAAHAHPAGRGHAAEASVREAGHTPLLRWEGWSGPAGAPGQQPGASPVGVRTSGEEQPLSRPAVNAGLPGRRWGPRTPGCPPRPPARLALPLGLRVQRGVRQEGVAATAPRKMQSCNITKILFHFMVFFFFQRCFVKQWKIIVSQVSLKSEFSCYLGCPGPISAFTYFYLFNHNQPPPRGLLFLEGENGTVVGLTDNKSRL